MKKIIITRKKLISFGLQLLVMIVVLWGISKWQAKDLLPEKTPAPDFKLSSLNGDTYALSESKGKKTVLYFFSPWCSVCKISSHNIVDIRKKYSTDAVQIYAIALSWKTPAEVKAFAEDHKLNVPVLLGDRSTGSSYSIGAFPTIYILNAEGAITDRLVGYTTELGMRLRL